MNLLPAPLVFKVQTQPTQGGDLQQQAQLELWVLEAQAGNIAAFEKLYQHFTPQVSAYRHKRTSKYSLAFFFIQQVLDKALANK
ncbi:hypothetical protein KJI95_17250 [Shewanella sp. JM162201]|uniref:Helix-turn-helix conjugative transposon-like domain-containing protein n=1 Tax=Shewanella jiangmenensis TaxID=2837387 RepID=A0ABS5V939_9GAMM|nr:hypothetical protein [Shewanella jiangmenensis]MBT1446246.1 hypothetical protein [Shewanella jiangmenensis]